MGLDVGHAEAGEPQIESQLWCDPEVWGRGAAYSNSPKELNPQVSPKKQKLQGSGLHLH